MPNVPTATSAAEADPRYVLRDRSEIVTIMRRLASEERPAVVTFGGEGDVLHTRIVDVSDDRRSVFVEWGPDDDTSERVVGAGAVTCQAELDKLRMHFTFELRPGRLEYRKVFVGRMPDVVLRVQRREYYRLAIQPDDGVVFTVVGPQPDGQQRASEVTLVDLSGGGVAFRVPLAAGALLRLHVELAPCTLTLADAGSLATRVRIRNLTKMVDDDGQAWVRVGAQFLDLRVGHIAQVQRFIGFIERRRREDERRRAELEARRAAALEAARRSRR